MKRYWGCPAGDHWECTDTGCTCDCGEHDWEQDADPGDPLLCEADVDDGQRACQARLVSPAGRPLYQGDDDDTAVCPFAARHLD